MRDRRAVDTEWYGALAEYTSDEGCENANGTREKNFRTDREWLISRVQPQHTVSNKTFLYAQGWKRCWSWIVTQGKAMVLQLEIVKSKLVGIMKHEQEGPVMVSVVLKHSKEGAWDWNNIRVQSDDWTLPEHISDLLLVQLDWDVPESSSVCDWGWT